MKRRITAILLTTALLALPTAASATAPPELSDARNAYRQSQREIAEQRHEQMLVELRLTNGPYGDSSGEFTWAVARWRPVVDRYFEYDRVDWALRIIECESHGDPQAKNPISSASGLFQHLGSLWPDRAAAAGWKGADVFDPFANIAVAAWLLDNGGPSHWVCKAHR
ncbi:MAG: lytic transglycosylase domain-containing protein [bacterium]|nr:lytic transglycosylase domain-containing protein [bacterium]